MDFDERIRKIDYLAQKYLKETGIAYVTPKDLMPYLIDNGVYSTDNREGNPLRNDLRTLKKLGNTNHIRGLEADQRAVNIYWSIGIAKD